VFFRGAFPPVDLRDLLLKDSYLLAQFSLKYLSLLESKISDFENTSKTLSNRTTQIQLLSFDPDKSMGYNQMDPWDLFYVDKKK